MRTLAEREAAEPAAHASTIAPGPGVRALLITSLAMLLALMALALWHAANPRMLPAWHGFLHSALAVRFPASGMPPENPFFAGEIVPYYWFYHFVGHLVQQLLGTDPIHAFQAIAFLSLALMIGAGAAIGYRRFGSLPAGLAIPILALIGGNPAGLVLAALKYAGGQPLLDAGVPATDHVFVDNDLADQLMARPLLPALTFTGDWRNGHNLPWLFDISSRTPALALLVLLLFLWLGRERPARLAGITAVAALTTALNPLIGLAATGALCAAQLPFSLAAFLRQGTRAGVVSLTRPGAAAIGLLIALPAFQHMLLLEGTSRISTTEQVALKLVLAGMVFLLLVPAAILGVRAAPAHMRAPLGSVALAGAFVVIAMIAFHLAEANEHNLSNLAQVVLAVPAAAWIAYGRWSRHGWIHFAAVTLLCAPGAVATLVAFAGRPAAPLGFEGRQLVRTGPDDSLQAAYVWIREDTPPDAIFVIDPRRPIKMGSNVSELPAFTARALLVDQPGYIVTPHADAAYRTHIAVTLVDGGRPDARDAQYLRAFDRSIFLFTYGAAPEVAGRHAELWGAPRFRRGPVAIYEIDGATDRSE